MDDFNIALQEYPDDSDIKMVQQALGLSQAALMCDAGVLPMQVTGRIAKPTQVRKIL